MCTHSIATAPILNIIFSKQRETSWAGIVGLSHQQCATTTVDTGPQAHIRHQADPSQPRLGCAPATHILKSPTRSTARCYLPTTNAPQVLQAAASRLPAELKPTSSTIISTLYTMCGARPGNPPAAQWPMAVGKTHGARSQMLRQCARPRPTLKLHADKALSKPSTARHPCM